MYWVIRIIVATALWVSASPAAPGAGDRSGNPAAEADGGPETDGPPGGVAHLHSLRLVDDSGNVIDTRPVFDRDTTSYATVLDDDTNAIALEISSAPGIRVGLAFQIVAGGMTMSRYVDLTKVGEERGSTVSYRHAFSDMATRGIFELIVRVATDDGRAANSYAIAVTRRDPALACRVEQTLHAGQRCRIPGGGVFEIHADGCVTGLPDLAGEMALGEGSMTASGFCIRGYVQKGGFRARANADASVWRIESLP